MVTAKKPTGKVASKTPAKKPADTAKKPASKGAVVAQRRAPKKPTVEERLVKLEDNSVNYATFETVDGMFVKKDDLDHAVKESIRQGDDVSEAVSNCVQNDSDIITRDNIDQHCPSKADLSALSNKVDSLSDTVGGLRKHRNWLWVGIIVLFLFASVAVLSPRSFDPVRDVMSMSNGSL